MHTVVLPLVLFLICLVGLAVALLVLGNLFGPRRVTPVKRMPYESGMDPIHDTRRRFDVRFYLLAVAFLVFDVELLFLYPWAVVFGSTGATGVAEAAADVIEGRPPLLKSITMNTPFSVEPVMVLFTGYAVDGADIDETVQTDNDVTKDGDSGGGGEGSAGDGNEHDETDSD